MADDVSDSDTHEAADAESDGSDPDADETAAAASEAGGGDETGSAGSADSDADDSGDVPGGGAATVVDGASNPASGRSGWKLDGRAGRVLAVVGAVALAVVVLAGVVWAGRAIFDRDGRSDRDHRGDDGHRGELIAKFDKDGMGERDLGKRGDRSIWWDTDADAYGAKGDGAVRIIIHRNGLKLWDGDFAGKDMFGSTRCPSAESPKAKCLGDGLDDFAKRRRGDLDKGDWGKHGWGNGDWGHSRRPGLLPEAWLGPGRQWGSDERPSPFGGQGFSGPFGGKGHFGFSGPFGGNGFMALLDLGWFERDGWGAPNVPGEGGGDFWGRLWDGDEGPWSDLDDLLGDGSGSWWDPDDLDEDERRELAEFCAALDSGTLLDELDDETGAGLLLFGFPIFESLFEELCSDASLDPDSQAEIDDGTAAGDA